MPKVVGPKNNSRDHEDCSVDPRLYVEEQASDDFNAGYNAAAKQAQGAAIKRLTM